MAGMLGAWRPVLARSVALLSVLVLGTMCTAVPAGADESWTPEKELAEIQEMIDNNGSDWEVGLTDMMKVPPEERGCFLGLKEPPADYVDRHTIGTLEALPRDDLPVSWDWRDLGGMTLPRQQGSCGSCWAFAAVGALESAYKITTGTEILYSCQQCISCNEYGDGCDGGFCETCYDLWTWFGSVPRSCFPYYYNDTYPCRQSECPVGVYLEGTITVPAHPDYWKTAVMTQPIVIGICGSTYGFMGYTGGCFDHAGGARDHVVVLCGWDDNACSGNGAWLIKNSWGASWGEGGYAWVQYGAASLGGASALLVIDIPPETRVAYRSHELIAGTNGALDPGETGQIKVTVTNYGPGGASGITGTLTSLTSGVTVIDDTASFANLGDWGTTTCYSPYFTVAVESGVPVGTLMEFQLDMHCNESEETSYFYDFVSPVDVLYSTDFESGSTGWTHTATAGSDTWQFGEPRSFDHQRDPMECASGSYLFGNDLNTDTYTWDTLYDNDSNCYLQSPAVNCTDQAGVHLRFSRWLSSEQSIYDVASILINDHEVWRNDPDVHHADNIWVPMVLDISDYADDNPSVRVKFNMYSDPYWKFGGWNVDDVEVIATNPDQATVDNEVQPRAALEITAYPNPFAPAASLRFTVPSTAATASLQIFDAGGRLVRTLHDGEIDGGLHMFTWTGTDDAGHAMPAGTYYCRAQAGDRSVVTKMIRLQ